MEGKKGKGGGGELYQAGGMLAKRCRCSNSWSRALILEIQMRVHFDCPTPGRESPTVRTKVCSPSAGTPFIRAASVHDPHTTGISRGSGGWWVLVHGSKLTLRLTVQEGAGEGGSSTIIAIEDEDVEGEAGGGNQAWRAWTILLVARMSSTCESVTGETEGSGDVRAPTTGEGVRVERGDGKADRITTLAMLGVTS